MAFRRPYGTLKDFRGRFPTLKHGANERCAYGAENESAALK